MNFESKTHSYSKLYRWILGDYMGNVSIGAQEVPSTPSKVYATPTRGGVQLMIHESR